MFYWYKSFTTLTLYKYSDVCADSQCTICYFLSALLRSVCLVLFIALSGLIMTWVSSEGYFNQAHLPCWSWSVRGHLDLTLQVTMVIYLRLRGRRHLPETGMSALKSTVHIIVHHFRPVEKITVKIKAELYPACGNNKHRRHNAH